MKRAPLLLLLAAGLGSLPALAEPRAHSPGPNELEEARQRFQRGVDLYREGSLDAALAEFQKAYELAPNYRVLYNLAQVQNERHDYAAALRLLQKYLEEGDADIPVERREQVTRDLAALRGRVAEVTVRANVDGGELLVDGVTTATLPLEAPVLVSAGVRQFQVRKPGYETSTRTETVAGGDTVRLDVKLEPIPIAPALKSPSEVAGGDERGAARRDPEPASATTPARSKAPVWVTLVTTGLLTGGAVTFGVLTASANTRLDRELDTFPGNKARIDDARSELKRDALLADVFAGSAVISGGFFLYFALSGGATRSTGEEKAVRVSPTARGVRITGTF
jgi:hypothetical protein